MGRLARQILNEHTPSGALCEVSLSLARYAQDVAGLLRQLPGSPNMRDANRLLLALLDGRLRGDADLADRVASALFQMAIANEIESEDLRRIGLWAWDALDLADEGHIEESRDQVVTVMAEALNRAASEAPITWLTGIPG